MSRHIPEHFVILRDGIRSPCLQLLQAVPSDDGYSYNQQIMRGCFEIVNPRRVENFQGRLITIPYQQRNNNSIYTLRYLPREGEDPQEVYYWITPYALETHGGQLIPLLEFQYRSWIPTGFDPILVLSNPYELFASLSRIQEEKLKEIRHREDNESIRHSRHHDIPSYHQPSTPPRIIETIRIVEVPVEKIVVHQKVLPIPKNVGDILIRAAREGKDSCPILQVPYSECGKLIVCSCFHVFDAESLTKWQETNTSCPVCRSKIQNIVLE